MKRLLKIMYDGSRYAGYQAQPDAPTVQRTLTDACTACFGFPCRVTGCSRTDAGVHALGFCAAVEPASPENAITVPAGRMHRALRPYLPADISVRGEAEVADDLHPRYSVVSKEYVYRMYDSPWTDPFREGRAWHLKRTLTEENLARMNAGGACLIGRHDFSSFMASGSRITDAVRHVMNLEIGRVGDFVELRIRADGFLYNMVRIITGTLVECAMGEREPESVETILAARDRRKAGKTAPPHGLYLNDVTYDRDIRWKID